MFDPSVQKLNTGLDLARQGRRFALGRASFFKLPLGFQMALPYALRRVGCAWSGKAKNTFSSVFKSSSKSRLSHVQVTSKSRPSYVQLTYKQDTKECLGRDLDVTWT